MSWDLCNVMEDTMKFDAVSNVNIYPPKLVQNAAKCILKAKKSGLTGEQRNALYSAARGYFKYKNVTSEALPMLQSHVRNYGKVDAVVFDVTVNKIAFSFVYSKDEKTLWYTFG